MFVETLNDKPWFSQDLFHKGNVRNEEHSYSDVLTDGQVEAIAAMKNDQYNFIISGRQTGLSTALMLRTAWQVVHDTNGSGRNILIASHDKRSSKHLKETLTEILHNTKEPIKIVTNTQDKMVFETKHGKSTVTFGITPNKCIGNRYTDVKIDNAEFVKNLNDILDHLTCCADTRITLASTNECYYNMQISHQLF